MKVNLSSAIIVPLVVLFCAGAIYAYIRYESSSKNYPTTSVGMRTESTSLPDLANRSQNTREPATNETLGVQSDGTISLNQNANAPSNAKTNRIPTPEEFEVYDKYKNDPNSYYAVIKNGSGESAKQGDFVGLVYKGWLTDGTVFDQTRKNEQGQLQAFGLTLGQGQVIRGWEESIPGMKVGEQRRLIVPPAAGYGDQGQGVIPPNAVLIFDVELVQIGETQP